MMVALLTFADLALAAVVGAFVIGVIVGLVVGK